jgi:MFS family permease
MRVASCIYLASQSSLLLESRLFCGASLLVQLTPVPFERRVVASLAALYSFRMFGLFMLLPVLALYSTDYSGSTPFLLGLALGAYGFSQALLQIPFGVLSDRIGRKPVIFVGLIIFILGSVLAAQADTAIELIIGRFLQGGGAISAAVMALLTDLTAEENRTKAMATIGASIGVSFSVALTVGPLMAAWGGVSSIFWLTAVLGLLGIFILFKIVPTVQYAPRRQREAGAVPALLWNTLKNPDLMRLNVGIFSLHFVLMANFMVLPLLLEQQLDIARDYHGLLYFPLLAAAFVVMLPFIIVAEKRRKLKPVFLGAIALLVLVELALIRVPPNMPLTLIVIFLFFAAFNLLEATLPSMVSKIAPAGSKGTATGIYATSQVLGVFAGGAVGGWLLQHWGIMAVLSVAALCSLLWLVIAWFMRPPRFLASVLIPLRDRDPHVILEKLRALDGVAEVLIVASENTIYLKVDPRVIDRQALSNVVENPA